MARRNELESVKKELAETRDYARELIQVVVPCFYNYPECPAKRQGMTFAALDAAELVKMEDKG
jgi:hypothetical protein